jgi:hypothetical protein
MSTPTDTPRTLETELAAAKAEFERLANPCGWPHCEPAKADAAELTRLRALSDQLSDNLSAVGAAYNAEKARAEKAEAELAAMKEASK